MEKFPKTSNYKRERKKDTQSEDRKGDFIQVMSDCRIKIYNCL